jgi:hypothetical protein
MIAPHAAVIQCNALLLFPVKKFAPTSFILKNDFVSGTPTLSRVKAEENILRNTKD